MCQGINNRGKRCGNKTEPYCRYHVNQINPVLAKLAKGPTKADGPGYIYVYSVETDAADTYYKIGSSVDPIKRVVKEWKGIMKKMYYVHFRQLAERVIHLELNKVRVYRYEVESGVYCSIWKESGEPVEPSDASLRATVHGYQKNVEWFRLPWEEMREKISVIINLINDRGYMRWGCK